MDSFQRSARNALRAHALERHAERRRDAAWLAGQLEDARLVLVAGSDFPARDGDDSPLFIDARQAMEQFRARPDEFIFLGHAERAWFAWAPDADSLGRLERDLGAGRRWDLRRAGALLDAATAGLLSYAKALCHWHEHARFCGRCGGPTRSADGGHQRICAATDCAVTQFPRLDPAVIVCITHGERVLLGRQSSWPECRYSAIAGFVEPGESLEDAVRREVHEETRLELADIHYHSSQPWPFPASLMLGFSAESVDGNARAADELEAVRWWTRAELERDVRAGDLLVSPPLSIAYRLLEHWYDAGGEGRLADLAAAGGGAQ